MQIFVKKDYGTLITFEVECTDSTYSLAQKLYKSDKCKDFTFEYYLLTREIWFAGKKLVINKKTPLSNYQIQKECTLYELITPGNRVKELPLLKPNLIENPLTLENCKHIFETERIKEYARNNPDLKNCPCCQKELSNSDILTLFSKQEEGSSSTTESNHEKKITLSSKEMNEFTRRINFIIDILRAQMKRINDQNDVRYWALNSTLNEIQLQLLTTNHIVMMKLGKEQLKINGETTDKSIIKKIENTQEKIKKCIEDNLINNHLLEKHQDWSVWLSQKLINILLGITLIGFFYPVTYKDKTQIAVDSIIVTLSA